MPRRTTTGTSCTTFDFWRTGRSFHSLFCPRTSGFCQYFGLICEIQPGCIYPTPTSKQSLPFSNSSVIHYTAFTSEGGTYCPWMKRQLLGQGVQFHERKVLSMDEVCSLLCPHPPSAGRRRLPNCYQLCRNRRRPCGGGRRLRLSNPWNSSESGCSLAETLPLPRFRQLYNPRVASSFPSEQAHFRIGGVYLGTVKQENNFDSSLTDNEVQEIWQRYIKLQPAMSVSYPLVKIPDSRI